MVVQKESVMEMSLPLDEMTSLEKIAVMEKLWDALCKDPHVVPSPNWHKDVLAEREERISRGEAVFPDVEDAKNRIRDQVK
jgi:hypothetical protein